MAIRDEEWQRIFDAKKARQVNHERCAAMIVACDCDWCLEKETDREREEQLDRRIGGDEWKSTT